MNEARRLGTCTDKLSRREKNDSLALSSTATTYVGFSVLPRSINIKSECAAFSIFVCMCASINTRKALNCEALTWEGGGVCFDPDAGLWPSGRLSSALMCRQSFP